MKPNKRAFSEKDLKRLAPAYPWLSPPKIGEAVTLNSGGPRMLVVDVDDNPQRCVVSYLSDQGAVEADYDWRLLRPWIEQ